MLLFCFKFYDLIQSMLVLASFALPKCYMMSHNICRAFYAIFWVMFRFQLFCRIIFQRSWTTVLLPIWKPRYLLWLCPGPIWSLYCFCILNEDDNVIKSNGTHRHCLDWVQPLGMNMNIKISICMGMVTVRVLCFLNARICTDTLAPYKNLSIVILNFKAQKLYHYCNLTHHLLEVPHNF